MKRDTRREQEQAQRLWRLSAMGGELAFGIIGMVLLGLGIDYFFKTGPWGVVVGVCVGVVGSGYNFIRQALALNRGTARHAAAWKSRPHSPPPPSPNAPKIPPAEPPDDSLELPSDIDKY